MAGRRTKLTPEVQKRICDAIMVGATFELASRYGGIHYDTFRTWMNQGEAGNSTYSVFSDAVKKAEAEAAVKWLAMIEKAAVESWQAAAWKLERRYPGDYGRNDKLRVDVKDAAPIVLKWDGATDDTDE